MILRSSAVVHRVSALVRLRPRAVSAWCSRLVLALVLSACGAAGKANAGPPADSGPSTPDAPAADAGDDADAAVPFPAFTVDVPQIRKNQGTVLEAPVLVTVTWPGDTTASTWEAFGDSIGASSFWQATTGEYGVGKVTSGPKNHVRMTTPLPAMMSYTDVQTFVAAAVQAAVPGSGMDAGAGDNWPAPVIDKNGDGQTVYALYIPATTDVTDPGSGESFCEEGALGYHDNIFLADNTPIAYAVTLECTSQTLSGLEETAAHETVEAATDPFTESSTLGYVGYDANHLSWDIYTAFQDELADACENWADSYFQETGSFPYWVQAAWSNAAAAAGHDPCVPHASTPYEGMTLFPSEESTMTLNLSAIGEPTTRTRGFHVSVGKPTTFHVGYYSDAPTAPWKIDYDFPQSLQVFDQSGNPLSNGSASVSLDQSTGQNGDMATVTVTVKARGEAGFHVMAITWDAPPKQALALPHYMPILLVDD